MTTTVEPAFDLAALKALAMPKVPKTFSYSRVSKYTDCPRLYYLQHVAKLLEAYSDTNPTKIGNWCHKALETVLQSEEDGLVPYEILAGKGGLWDQELEKLKLTALKPKLQTYAHHYTQVMVRANPNYRGADKIRKADGSVPSMPLMTKDGSAYSRQHKMPQMALDIDAAARRADPDNWTNTSLSTVYAESLGIMYQYQHPEGIYEVLQVELPISELRMLAADEKGNPLFDDDGEAVTTSRVRGPHPMFTYKDEAGKDQVIVLDILNPFYLPKVDAQGKLVKDENGELVFRDDACFSGYIDLLDRDRNGELGVSDHKTNGGDIPVPAKIARNEQFNVYGLIVEELTGEVVKWLRMNHLRSSSLISAPFDREQAEEVLERLLSLITAIEKKVFTKHHPDAYVTRCHYKNWKGDTELCEGFKLCYPKEYAEFAMKAAA